MNTGDWADQRRGAAGNSAGRLEKSLVRKRLESSAVWVLPAVFMLVAGVWRAAVPEMWRDEIASWSASTRSYSGLWKILQHVDASAGFYYASLHVWITMVGDSHAALRLLSALAMAGAAAFIAATARRLFCSPVAGLAAGLLFALPPIISRYAQETRAYALAVCAFAAATWFLLRALDRPGLARWTAYTVCIFFSGAYHLVSLAGVAGQLPLVLLAVWRWDTTEARAEDRPRWRLLWQFPLALLPALVMLIPLMMLGRSQAGRQLGWISRPVPDSLLDIWQLLYNGPDLLSGFLILAALALLLPGRRLAATATFLLATVPVPVVYLLSQGQSSYFIDRYLLFIMPACAALAGGGIGMTYLLLRALRSPHFRPQASAARTQVVSIRARRSRVVGLTLAAALAVGTVLPAVKATESTQRVIRGRYGHNGSDFEGAAAIIAANQQPGDALVTLNYTATWAMIGPEVSYYLRGAALPKQIFIDRSADQVGDIYPAENISPQGSAVGAIRRIWLVTFPGDNLYQGFAPDQAKVLQSDFGPAEVRQLRGLTLALLTRDTHVVEGGVERP